MGGFLFSCIFKNTVPSSDSASWPPRIQRLPIHRTRITRRDFDHSPPAALVAEKESRSRTEFGDPLSGVNVLEHGGQQGALEVSAGRQRPSLDHCPAHVPGDVPAGAQARMASPRRLASVIDRAAMSSWATSSTALAVAPHTLHVNRGWICSDATVLAIGASQFGQQ
jgi:hypothetical protein